MSKQLVTAIAAVCISKMACGADLSIGIDVSKSNPLVSDKNFAEQAVKYVGSQIVTLKPGDTVSVRTFGSRANARNFKTLKLRISNKMRAPQAAHYAMTFTSKLLQDKSIPQSSTNIIAWLEFTPNFNCEREGQILLITDGLEASTYVEPVALLEGKAHLPAPDVDLTGCSITFYGLGAGWNPQHTKNVRNEWREWAQKAGANFSVLIPG